MTPQEKMKSTLERAGIPFKHIRCYGSQIVVTAWSDEAARKWVSLLSNFATVRGMVRSIEETQDTADIFKANPGLMKKYIMHDVWLVFARV